MNDTLFNARGEANVDPDKACVCGHDYKRRGLMSGDLEACVQKTRHGGGACALADKESTDPDLEAPPWGW
jgi:hypothetical protein